VAHSDPTGQAAVPAKQWGDIWRRARAALCPEADPSCKDPSRAYWLPSHNGGVTARATCHDGTLLDPAALPELPPEPMRAELRRSPTAHVLGWHHVHGEIHLLVTLPDGSRGYLPAAATALWQVQECERAALILTSDGVRRLRSWWWRCELAAAGAAAQSRNQARRLAAKQLHQPGGEPPCESAA